ncbi:uridine kinase family-domain-containing protein [Syncephalastrum racemosum]|uniref:uridine/cytidine kinase n=1 Tax=Syncephalastrum racemosum TaxID=13706 RepID=A0A1X2H0I3_SYNRA|nr:uridine kinase family-domain-containing protein [Syncephalastrum racemosum]
MSIDSSAYNDPSYFKLAPQSSMLVAVAGGADAGKRNVCDLLMTRLSGHYAAKLTTLSLTDFYRELTEEERASYEQGQYNMDHPEAYDFDLLYETLMQLISGHAADVPVFDMLTHTRTGTRRVEPVDVILVEGTLVLYPKQVRDLFFMKVFIDVDSDQRLARRVSKPDHSYRNGRRMTLQEILVEYVEFVKPMFDDFVSPSKKFADIIIPRGTENPAALQVLGHHLEDHLKSRARANEQSSHNGTPSTKRSKSPTPLWSRRQVHQGLLSPTPSASSSAGPSRAGSFRNLELLGSPAERAYKQVPE